MTISRTESRYLQWTLISLTSNQIKTTFDFRCFFLLLEEMRQGSLKDNPLLDPILVRALADVNVVTVEGLLCEDHRSLVAQGLAEEQLEESLLACATFYGGHQTTLSEVVHGELGPEFRPCGQKEYECCVVFNVFFNRFFFKALTSSWVAGFRMERLLRLLDLQVLEKLNSVFGWP